jgi:hypothetical protein
MKIGLTNVPALTLALTLAGSLGAFGQTQHHQPANAHSGGAGVSVKSENGRTVVVWQGKEVFSGQTTGHVVARSANINGVDLAAAFAGDHVIWESSPGAAQHLRAADHADPAVAPHQLHPTPDQPNPHHASAGGATAAKSGVSASSGAGHHSGSVSSASTSAGASTSHSHSASTSTGISVKQSHGETVVTYAGKDYNLGSVQGHVSTKTRTGDGVAYAAAYAGDKVIWENVPGAGEKLR